MTVCFPSICPVLAPQRRQFGRPVIDFQGLSFLLADMATAVAAARALYVTAARRKPREVISSPSGLAVLRKLIAS